MRALIINYFEMTKEKNVYGEGTYEGGENIHALCKVSAEAVYYATELTQCIIFIYAVGMMTEEISTSYPPFNFLNSDFMLMIIKYKSQFSSYALCLLCIL
jgi:hypothetical protein